MPEYARDHVLGVQLVLEDVEVDVRVVVVQYVLDHVGTIAQEVVVLGVREDVKEDVEVVTVVVLENVEQPVQEGVAPHVKPVLDAQEAVLTVLILPVETPHVPEDVLDVLCVLDVQDAEITVQDALEILEVALAPDVPDHALRDVRPHAKGAIVALEAALDRAKVDVKTGALELVAVDVPVLVGTHVRLPVMETAKPSALVHPHR